MEGLWSYPIERVSSDTGPHFYKVVFYENRDNSLSDMIRFAGVRGQKSLVVRGYDYRKVRATDVFLPTRIEVFETNPAGVIQHRLLKIDYHN